MEQDILNKARLVWGKKKKEITKIFLKRNEQKCSVGPANEKRGTI